MPEAPVVVHQWSPWFAWTMDVLKFALTFSMAAAVTVVFLHRDQEQRAARQALAQEQRAIRQVRADIIFQLQLDAIREFRRTATAYDVAALSAYTDLYQWDGPEKTATMLWYEGTAFGEFSASLEGLQSRFAENDDALRLIKELEDTIKKRHKIYDKIVDSQLDQPGRVDMWATANSKRQEFNGLLQNAKRLRQNVISVVERQIVPL